MLLRAAADAWAFCPSTEGVDAGLGLEVHSSVFAAVLLDFVGDLLAFIETVEARALHRADMDEHVLAAASG